MQSNLEASVVKLVASDLSPLHNLQETPKGDAVPSFVLLVMLLDYKKRDFAVKLMLIIMPICALFFRSKTVCSFFTASERYGLVDIKEHCMTWLLHCLMAPNNAPMLSDIS